MSLLFAIGFALVKTFNGVRNADHFRLQPSGSCFECTERRWLGLANKCQVTDAKKTFESEFAINILLFPLKGQMTSIARKLHDSLSSVKVRSGDIRYACLYFGSETTGVCSLG
ncbi:unnamed protein product [Cylicocyclus nassatus]|uniref:Uncharacterized protein n=1 Tax=Cylicocyclus nassatus TaxID=53992 RepID=A0AA36M0D1_CYLNA|nr:unnamed protein product [Cylicocyclus nassatus]